MSVQARFTRRSSKAVAVNPVGALKSVVAVTMLESGDSMSFGVAVKAAMTANSSAVPGGRLVTPKLVALAAVVPSSVHWVAPTARPST